MWSTEAEARQRWCPHARTVRREEVDQRDPGTNLAVVGGINRARVSNEDPSFPASCRCYASACMSWRWQSNPAPEGERRGYCGLAGLPFQMEPA